MNAEREMTLDEWCARLPNFHLVNKELRELRAEVQMYYNKSNDYWKRLNNMVNTLQKIQNNKCVDCACEMVATWAIEKEWESLEKESKESK